MANIVCSLLTDIQGGRLLFITKNRPHWVVITNLSKWIDTISCQRKFDIMRLLFENWPLFFDAPKCRHICRHLKNIIFTFVLCMEIHKLCYTLTPEQLLEMWNYQNITKNFVRNLFLSLYWFNTYLFDIGATESGCPLVESDYHCNNEYE